MKTFAALLFVSFCAWADGSTCLQPAPTTVPVADRVIVFLPKDGGVTSLSDGGTTTGCAISAFGNSSVNAGVYSIGNGVCATAASMGQRAFANDNGWADGGAP